MGRCASLSDVARPLPSAELSRRSAALALGQGADEFLGTQGDPWDTQSDMSMALVGAVCSLLSCSRLHDRQLRRLGAV